MFFPHSPSQLLLSPYYFFQHLSLVRISWFGQAGFLPQIWLPALWDRLLSCFEIVLKSTCSLGLLWYSVAPVHHVLGLTHQVPRETTVIQSQMFLSHQTYCIYSCVSVLFHKAIFQHSLSSNFWPIVCSDHKKFPVLLTDIRNGSLTPWFLRKILLDQFIPHKT